MNIPKNWPKKHTYSPVSVGTDTHIALLRLVFNSSRPEDLCEIVPCIEEKKAHPSLEIRKITTRLSYKGPKPHPLAHLKDEHGVFAKEKILKDAVLGEFVGEISLQTPHSIEKDRAFNWIVRWKNQFFWCIDSTKIANEMAYVNDYRGLKNGPNACIKWIAHRGFYYVVYTALRDIELGEEILIYYGEDSTDYSQIHKPTS